jgi:site-specific recombinase
MRFLLQLLERHDQRREEFSKIVASILSRSDASALFAQTELTEQSGFFSEIFRRLSNKLFPPVPRPGELSYSVEVVFNDDDVEWLEAMPLDDWEKLIATLKWSDETMEAVRTSLMTSVDEALANISIQIAALALTPELRPRLREMPEAGSAYLELVKSMTGENKSERISEALRYLAWCRASVDLAYRGIETSGVSLALLYRLETLVGLMSRLELLLKIASRETGMSERSQLARDLLVDTVRVRSHRRSVGLLLKMNFDIFARKLVEHAGETGEHYITRTRSEYWAMLRSGGGGGLWMVPSTFLKFMISSAKFPAFFEGLFSGINYSTTFMLMHFTGASLATKQPSMTAAALAERLSSRMSREKLEEFVEEVTRITRSQFIAAVGNVGFAMPGVFIVSWIYKVITGSGPLSPAYAQKVIHSLHPWETPSLLYASIAGVLLWFSSLCAGWLQNLVIYRQLPEAIAHHRTLNDFLGEERCKKIGAWLLRNASGIGGNVSIGFLLAFAPIIGILTGLPIDIRHVTISSAQLTIGLMSVDPSTLNWKLIVPPALGVVLIGIFNFGVSTALALFVAVRAKRVRSGWVRLFLFAVGRKFRKKPWTFLLPPKADAKVETSTHSH